MSATYIGRLRRKVVEQAKEIVKLKRRLGENPEPVCKEYFEGAPYAYRATIGSAVPRCEICQVPLVAGDVIKIRTPLKPSEATRVYVHEDCCVA